MNIESKIGIGCIFTVQKIREDGVITYQGEPFYNTALDCGMLSLFDNGLATMMQYINIGSGSTAPDVAQTGLADYRFCTNNVSALERIPSYQPFCFRYKSVFQFAAGSCPGDFTELGLSKSPNSEYYNRQLFKNAAGESTTIHVAANEGLQVIAEIIFYPDLKPYSEIFRLDLKSASVGSIYFAANPTVGFPVTTIRDPGAFKKALEGIFGASSILNVFKDGGNDAFIICTNPANGQALPAFTIDHLSSNWASAIPELTVIQTFESRARRSFTLHDMVSSQDITHNCLIAPWQYVYGSGSTAGTRAYDTMLGTASSDAQASGWGEGEGFGGITLFNSKFSNIGCYLVTTGKTIIAPTTLTITKPPTLTDHTLEVKMGFDQAAIQSKTVRAFIVRFVSYFILLYQMQLDTPITFGTGETFELNLKLSWGRYTPATQQS